MFSVKVVDVMRMSSRLITSESFKKKKKNLTDKEAKQTEYSTMR